ncbi:MAG: glycine cleavage system protein GcvH [Nitrososphaeria archaeon]|nr:glycine cleavage system protein GcvH [Nitrososphaeria archaeon]NIN52469.1 glycine cleavage system protein GcvH [Nitrososphaeria archaeon]NIQ32975.1 glycine cleavage system protein GcvH [Nitrososphaeria archaeon]
MDFPDDLHYSKDHMYAKVEDDIVVVGLTDYGQDIAGAIEYIDELDEGEELTQNEAFTSIETGKWVGALKSPISGAVAEFNEKLMDQPDLINSDPYGEGWMVKTKPSDLGAELAKLQKVAEHVEFVKEEMAKKEG